MHFNPRYISSIFKTFSSWVGTNALLETNKTLLDLRSFSTGEDHAKTVLNHILLIKTHEIKLGKKSSGPQVLTRSLCICADFMQQYLEILRGASPLLHGLYASFMWLVSRNLDVRPSQNRQTFLDVWDPSPRMIVCDELWSWS